MSRRHVLGTAAGVGAQGAGIRPGARRDYRPRRQIRVRREFPLRHGAAVETKLHRPIAQIAVGKSPWNVAFRPEGAFAYVTNANEDTISVVDTGSHEVTAQVSTEHVPTGIAATADAIWVTNNASSSVQGISTSTLKVQNTAPLGVSSEPSGVVII